MRILLITPYLTVGGADRYNLNLVRLLAARGHTLSVIATLPGAHEWKPLFGSVTPDVTLLADTVDVERQPAFVRDVVRSRDIQAVVVTNSQLGYALLPYLRHHCPDVALVDIVHAVEEHWLDGGYPRVSLNHAGWIDLTVAVSQDLRGWMVARGGDPARITVCTANIDADEWNPALYDRRALRDSLGIAADIPVILFVGRLALEKRPRLAVEVMRELTRRGLPYAGLLIGDGPERQPLENALRDPLLKQVRLLGTASAERVRELMAAADIVFQPSAREGIALALYEAMAMGCAVVAADVGGQRELVTPDCGTLVAPAPDEAAEYAEALAGLLTDPERRAMMGVNARRWIVGQFRLEQLGERFETQLDAAVARLYSTPRLSVNQDEARASEARAIAQARHDRDVARLWRNHGGDGDLSLARRGALALVRIVRSLFRPLFRRIAARDGHWFTRVVLRVRDRLVGWVYRSGD